MVHSYIHIYIFQYIFGSILGLIVTITQIIFCNVGCGMLGLCCKFMVLKLGPDTIICDSEVSTKRNQWLCHDDLDLQPDGRRSNTIQPPFTPSIQIHSNATISVAVKQITLAHVPAGITQCYDTSMKHKYISCM